MLLGSISHFCPFAQWAGAQFLVGSDNMYAACQPCCIMRWDLLICCAVYDDLMTFAEAVEEIGECL